MKKRLGLLEIGTFNSPDDLILAGRSVKDKIRRWNNKGCSDKFDGLIAVAIDVEVDVANFLEALLGSGVRAVLDRVHTDKNVGASAVLFQKHGLEFNTRDDFRFRDALKGVTQPSIPNENGDVIRWLKKRANVFRRCQRFGRERR